MKDFRRTVDVSPECIVIEGLVLRVCAGVAVAMSERFEGVEGATRGHADVENEVVVRVVSRGFAQGMPGDMHRLGVG